MAKWWRKEIVLAKIFTGVIYSSDVLNCNTYIVSLEFNSDGSPIVETEILYAFSE